MNCLPVLGELHFGFGSIEAALYIDDPSCDFWIAMFYGFLLSLSAIEVAGFRFCWGLLT